MISVLHRKPRNELRVSYQSLGMERSAEHEAETSWGQRHERFWCSPWTQPAQNPQVSVLMLCLVRNSWKCGRSVWKTEVIFAIEQMANAFLSQFSICCATILVLISILEKRWGTDPDPISFHCGFCKIKHVSPSGKALLNMNETKIICNQKSSYATFSMTVS